MFDSFFQVVVLSTLAVLREIADVFRTLPATFRDGEGCQAVWISTFSSLARLPVTAPSPKNLGSGLWMWGGGQGFWVGSWVDLGPVAWP